MRISKNVGTVIEKATNVYQHKTLLATEEII